MQWVPAILPLGSDPALIEYLNRELNRLSLVLELPINHAMVLQTLVQEPARPQEGMIVKADGANWDPGSGAGLYCYIGGVWKKFTLT